MMLKKKAILGNLFSGMHQNTIGRLIRCSLKKVFKDGFENYSKRYDINNIKVLFGNMTYRCLSAEPT